jgi:hypothetical protein
MTHRTQHPAPAKHDTRILMALFLVAAIVQFAFLLVLPGSMRRNDNTDYWSFYKPVGENILAGHGVVDVSGKFASTYPPGYSVAAAFVFGVSRFAGISQARGFDVFDVLVLAASGVLVFLISNLIFGGLIGYASFALWITYPANLWLIKQPNSEVPFLFLLLSAVLVFLKTVLDRRFLLAFVCGVFLGFAGLVRPIGVFLPLFFAVAALCYGAMTPRDRIKTGLLVCCGFVVCVLPWESFLYSRTGQMALLCTNGPATMSEGLVFAVEPIDGVGPMWVPAAMAAFMERAMTERPSMKTASNMVGFVANEAERNPKGFAELILMKLYRPWYSTYARRHDWLNLAYQLVYMPLGVAGMVLGLRRYRSQAFWIAFLGSLVLYFWGMAFLVIPLFRYLVPPMTFVMIFSAIAVESIVSRFVSSAKLAAGDSRSPEPT